MPSPREGHAGLGRKQRIRYLPHAETHAEEPPSATTSAGPPRATDEPFPRRDINRPCETVLVTDREQRWAQMLDALIVYVDTNGHANVPRSYVTHQGDSLGAWLHRQRTLARQQRLPQNRHAQLTDAGVRWTMSDRTAALASFARFVTEHGHGLVPHAYRDSDNFPLGVWVQSRRRQSRRDPSAAQRLWPELGTSDFVWEVRNRDQQWAAGLNALRLYRQDHGDCLTPHWYVDSHGFPLGRWVDSRRADRRAGRLPADRITALDTLGMVWILRDSPEPTSRLRRHDNHFTSMLHRTHTWTTHVGTLPRSRDRDTNGVAIGRWLQRQRHLHRTGQMPPHRLRELETALPRWTSTNHRQ